MYKLGKLPARPGAIKFSVRQYLPKLPPSPSRYGHQKLIPNSAWGMLGNDRYGDCVFAGAAHETILWNKEAKREVPFSDQAVLSDYAAVTGFDPNTGANDNGTDMGNAASYRRHTGVLDSAGKRHKVAAYLDIKAGDKETLKAAIHLFSGVGVGFEFPASAMTQFNNGKPWAIVRGAQIDGGHYVAAVGYDSNYIHVVTWGRLQKMTWGFFKKYCDEAVAYLSTERLVQGKSLEGFDASQLQADLSALPT